MAKTSTIKAPKGQSEPQVQLDKEQKKQAKREAKLKLKIELIQKHLQKAERKATRANADVDTFKVQLRELNDQLGPNHIPSNHQEVEPNMAEIEQTVANTGPVLGEEHETSSVSDAKEDSVTDQEESKHIEE